MTESLPNIRGLALDYAEGRWITPHAHDAHQIVHASTGVLRVVSDRNSWVVPPGRAIWMPARRTHAIHCRTAVQMRTVYVRDDIPGLPATCAVWSVSPLMREILVRLSESTEARGRSHLAALLFLEIETITMLPFHLPLPEDRRLRRLTDAISADPSESRPLKQWARLLGMSERTLIRRFNDQTGMTFRQWRRQARLLAGVERLAAGQPVTTVAFDVGYETVSAFVAAFREAFGDTPGRYTKAAKLGNLAVRRRRI